MAEDELSPSSAHDDDSSLYYAGPDTGEETSSAEPLRNEKIEKLPSAWPLWLKLWLRPSTAWEHMRNAALKPVRLASSVFYPLAALAALSVAADLVYTPAEPSMIPALLQKATIVFVAFFMAYFAIFPIIAVFTGSATSQRFTSDFGRCYIMSILSTLALIYTVSNLFPFLEAVIAFMPLYTFYIAYQGIEELHLPGKTIAPWIIACGATLLLPLGIYELFAAIMPK